MEVTQIRLADAYESPTNPRGQVDEKSLAELAASIKEKGVLVPVIVRKNPRDKKTWEVVAGNRRYRAAGLAGLAEIPASVREFSDDEAREVQIIENLQREDVHPMEEGNAYRELIARGVAVKDVAVRVGKSESYVRQRVYLTDLVPGFEDFYRKGKLPDSFAPVIAKLAPEDQAILLRTFKDRPYQVDTLTELKEHIAKQFYGALKNQPWLHDKEAAAAIGYKAPEKSASVNLFNEKVEAGITFKEWEALMVAYVGYLKTKHTGAVMVSTDWGTPDTKGAYGKSSYHLVEGKKDDCDRSVVGIVVEGDKRVGSTVTVCVDEKCAKHKGKSLTRGTPQDREKRRAELKKQREDEAKKQAALLKKLSGVKWPMSEQVLDLFLRLEVKNLGELYARPVGARHGWEPIMRKGYAVGSEEKPRMAKDWSATLNRELKKMTNAQKLALLIEVLLERHGGYDAGELKQF